MDRVWKAARVVSRSLALEILILLGMFMLPAVVVGQALLGFFFLIVWAMCLPFLALLWLPFLATLSYGICFLELSALALIPVFDTLSYFFPDATSEFYTWVAHTADLSVQQIASVVPPRLDFQRAFLQRRRQALYEKLDQMCGETFIRTRVTALAQGFKITDVQVNRSLWHNGFLSQRFLDTLTEHEHSLRSLPDLPALLDESTSLDPLVVAFHGTPRANIPSILRHGLLPSARIRNQSADFFSTDLHVTRSYTDNSGPFQAVVFLLLRLIPAHVPEYYDYIVINNAAYQLPLAVITIEAAE